MQFTSTFRTSFHKFITDLRSVIGCGLLKLLFALFTILLSVEDHEIKENHRNLVSVPSPLSQSESISFQELGGLDREKKMTRKTKTSTMNKNWKNGKMTMKTKRIR